MQGFHNDDHPTSHNEHHNYLDDHHNPNDDHHIPFNDHHNCNETKARAFIPLGVVSLEIVPIRLHCDIEDEEISKDKKLSQMIFSLIRGCSHITSAKMGGS